MKAQEEVDRVLQGRPPTYDDIKDLKYLTRCINESLRLYPHPPVGCIAFPSKVNSNRTGKNRQKVYYSNLFIILSYVVTLVGLDKKSSSC